MGDIMSFTRPPARLKIRKRWCSCPLCDEYSNDEKMRAVFDGFVPVAATLRLRAKTQKPQA